MSRPAPCASHPSLQGRGTCVRSTGACALAHACATCMCECGRLPCAKIIGVLIFLAENRSAGIGSAHTWCGRWVQHLRAEVGPCGAVEPRRVRVPASAGAEAARTVRCNHGQTRVRRSRSPGDVWLAVLLRAARACGAEMAVLAETRYHARDTLCLPATLQRHVYCLVHRSHVLRCSHCCWAPGEWCLWAGFRENQVRARCRGRMRRTRVRRASVTFLTRGDSGLCCDAASAPAHLLCARETRLGGGDCSSGIAVLSASGRDTLHEPLLCLLPRPTAWAQARACCRSTADCLSHHRPLRSL